MKKSVVFLTLLSLQACEKPVHKEIPEKPVIAQDTLAAVSPSNDGAQGKIPEVKTIEIAKITGESALCFAEIESNSEIYFSGICWGLKENPTEHMGTLESTTIMKMASNKKNGYPIRCIEDD